MQKFDPEQADIFTMKKYYVSLAAVGLLLGFIAKSNYWFEDERDVFFPITKEQLKVKKTQSGTGASNPVSNALVGSTPVDLAHISQNELFGELFNNKVLQQEPHQQAYFKMIEARLNSPYPSDSGNKHSGPVEREISNRLGLLRAMGLFWIVPADVKSVDRNQLKNFFAHLAKSKTENLMVRRQAYKNWLSFGNTVSQIEKNRMAENADSRLLHLVSLSDENLIESLTDSAE